MINFSDALGAFMTEAEQLLDHLRSERLHAIDMLDTDPEDVFDEITKLAALITDIPSSALVMVEGNRSFVKSTFNGPYTGNHPRCYSFCAVAIKTPAEPLWIPNSTDDDRFRDNPYVTSGGVLFYLGVPVLDSDGIALGTLCVFDSRPHDLELRTVLLLQQLGRVIERILIERLDASTVR